MEYQLLGPIEVRRNGEALDLGVRHRALVALMLIEANRVVSTDHIIDELWPSEPVRDHRNALWVMVSRLRGLLDPDRGKRTDGSVIVTQPPGYMLVADPDTIDARRFEMLAGEGRALLDHDPEAASRALWEAIGLWRGHALEEFTYAPFAAAEIARLEELRLTTVEDRIEADLRCGRCRAVVPELQGLVRRHPARERLVIHLMEALHRSGRPGDALQTLAEHARYVADELGQEPSDTIARVEQRLVAHDPVHRPDRGVACDPDLATTKMLSDRGYELREQIGVGSTGRVFAAFQPAVGREVAIKIMRPELATDPNFIRWFEAEARVVASLEHVRIVPIYDYWREPDAAFLVMRRFVGGSLQDAIGRTPTSAGSARRIVAQIGDALSTAHEHGVFHGDLRPGNVLIDGAGDAYVADFGVSYDQGDRPSDQEFLAPEQLDTAVPSPAADQYALGALTSRLVEGSDVGPAIAAVLARACDRRPTHRFDDVRSFVSAFVDGTAKL